MLNERSLDTLCAGLCGVMGVDAPAQAAPACEPLMAYAAEKLAGRKADRVLMFNPDAVAARIQWGLDAGYTVMADTPEELAEKMGVDPVGFAETLKRYNEMCAKGHDDEFGKRKELLIPLDKPPYIARKFGPALLAVVGGVKVNLQMQVLDSSCVHIPGLYAIGNTAGGRYGVDYPMLIPGNSHGSALTFGYLLGRQFGKEG